MINHLTESRTLISRRLSFKFLRCTNCPLNKNPAGVKAAVADVKKERSITWAANCACNKVLGYTKTGKFINLFGNMNVAKTFHLCHRHSTRTYPEAPRLHFVHFYPTMPGGKRHLVASFFFLRLSPGPHTSIYHRKYTERERQKIFSPTGHVRNHTMHISAPCHETLEGKMGSIFVNPWCGVGPFYLAFLGGGNSQMYTFPSSFFSPV